MIKNFQSLSEQCKIPYLVHSLWQGISRPGGEGGFEVGELSHARPDILGGSAHDAEDAEQLIDLGVALEQRLLVCHLKGELLAISSDMT